MIEISFGKLALLAIIALIVLGPEKLPGAARTAGALLRRMRSGWDNVRAEVERELQIEEIKRVAREAAARAEAAQAELDVAVQKVRNIGSELQPARLGQVEVEVPAVTPTLANASGSDDEVLAGTDEGSHTGDLFGPPKAPTEPPHGNL